MSTELEELKSRLLRMNNKNPTSSSTPSLPYTKPKMVQKKIPLMPKQIIPQQQIDAEEEDDTNFEEEMKILEEEQTAEAQYQHPADEDNEEYSDENYDEQLEQPEKPQQIQQPPPQRLHPLTKVPLKGSMEERLQRIKYEQQTQQTQNLQQTSNKQQNVKPKQTITQQQNIVQQTETKEPSPEEIEQFREQLSSEIIRLRDQGEMNVEILYQLNRLNTNLEILIKTFLSE